MQKNILQILILLSLAIAANAQVKVGNNPTTLNPSAALEIESTNKGFLPPRVALVSTTDAITIPTPAKGLIVYNIGGAIGVNGIYVNNGSTSAPQWDYLSVQNETVGVAIAKQRLVTASSSIVLATPSGDFSFRITEPSGGKRKWQIMFNGPGTRNVIIFGVENFVYTPAGYGVLVSKPILNTQTWIDLPLGTPLANELNTYRVYDLDSTKVYRVELMLLDGDKEFMLIEEF